MRIYYGWFVLAASAVAEALAQGATSYAAGLFVLPLQAEFHLSRANANSAVLILFLGSALAAPLAGRLLDRWPIRRVMTLGVLLFCGALAFIATTPSLAAMALALLIPGAIGFMCIGPLTTSTLASRWFLRRRGLALGIAAVATSAGGFVAVPLSLAIQRYGWRQGLLFEAVAIALVMLLLTWLVLRDTPAATDLDGDPENRAPAETPVAAAAPLRWREIFTTRAFWIPALTVATISGACQATVVTLVPYGVQLGLAPTAAAALVSAFALCAAVTKILAGLLADRINPHLLLVAAAAFMTLSWLAVSLVARFPALLAASCLAGIALGCALPTASSLIATAFGPARFGRVMSWAYALTLVLALVAVRFVGFMYDRFGGYHAAFLSFFLLLAGLLALTLAMRPRRHA
ncbi:MAG TPA: MFS transporter [Rhizomicrobium sp.]